MGIIDKIKQKVGDSMEKFSGKHMTGASKEEYEAEKNASSEIKEGNAKEEESSGPAKNIRANYSKEDFSNLEELLKKSGAICEQGLWVAGYPSHKINQNPAFANFFNKNKFRFLAINQDTIYLLAFKNNEIYSYKTYTLNDVKKVEYSAKLFTNNFDVKFHDNTSFKIAVAANKSKIAEVRKKLK